jgi:hypothetical protein
MAGLVPQDGRLPLGATKALTPASFAALRDMAVTRHVTRTTTNRLSFAIIPFARPSGYQGPWAGGASSIKTIITGADVSTILPRPS